MTKYQCGHEVDLIIIADSAISLTAYIEWAQTVGRDGDKTQCWGCWCRHGNFADEERLKRELAHAKEKLDKIRRITDPIGYELSLLKSDEVDSDAV
jgi:hypothetical protein